MAFGKAMADWLEELVSWVDLDIRRRGSLWHRARDLPRVPTVVDVGVGRRGTPPLYRLFPESRFILIDPLEECREGVKHLLRKEGNVFVAAALGASDGTATLNVHADLSQSSLLDTLESTGEGIVQETREIPLRRLDEVLAELEPDHPIGLKVDTEGYELEVLEGAPRTLRLTAFVILEVNVRPRFEGSYSFEQAIRYMSDAGFRVHALLHAGTRKCDIAFVRNDRHVAATGEVT